LTGGAAVQQGIQMVQNTMMVAGIWSATSARAPIASRPGGVIQSGVGLPYAAGRAVAAGAQSIARQGRAVARIAAYRLAARRGM
jgi:type IV secretion system protein VirB6